MHIQDGVASDHRCPNDFEPNGGTLARNRERDAASDLAASISARFAGGPKFPYDFNDYTSARTILSFSPEPRTLTRGGAAAALTITGVNLSEDDEIVYGDAGITDAGDPALTPVTYDSSGNTNAPHWDVLVLLVQASGGTPFGAHSLTYGDQTYYNVFEVRA